MRQYKDDENFDNSGTIKKISFINNFIIKIRTEFEILL